MTPYGKGKINKNSYNDYRLSNFDQIRYQLGSTLLFAQKLSSHSVS